MSDTELARRVEALWDYREKMQGPHRKLSIAEKDNDWIVCKARHGLVPPPAVGTGERWWKRKDYGTVWNLRADGTIRFRLPGQSWSTSISTLADVERDTGLIETDATGAPLAVPERTGAGPRVTRGHDLDDLPAEPAETRDGMEERAKVAYVTPEYNPLMGPAALVKFARSETSALAAENERLRGQLSGIRSCANRVGFVETNTSDECLKLAGLMERDIAALRRRVAELEAERDALKCATGAATGMSKDAKWAYAAFKFSPDGANVKGDGVKRKPSPRRAPARGKTGRTKRKDRP